MADVGLLARYKVDNSDFTKKTNEAKRSLEQFGIKGTEVGKKMSSLTNALNINVGSLSKLALGLGAASTAIKIASDALKQNENAMDEWGRITKSAESAYKGFLNAINTGNISGYLQNMNNIVKAARAAYDAIDDLGTFNAFNQINSAKHQATFTEALANYKAGTGTKADITNAAGAVKADLRSRQKKEQEAYITAINDLAAQRGVNSNLLRDVLMGSNENYERVKNLGLSKTEYVPYAGGQFGGGGTYAKKVAGTAMEKIGQVLRGLTDEELKNLQALGAAAEQTSREIANVDKQVARYINETGGRGGGGGGKSTGPTIDKPWSKLKGKYTDSMKSLGTISGGSFLVGGSGIDSAAANMDLSGIARAADEWNRYRQNLIAAHEANQMAISSIGQVGSTLQMLEQPAAKVMGIVAEAIANVALAAGQAMAARDTTASGWAWIGAAAAITGTMITSIAAIKSATAGSYAEGGMIPGSRYSGDMQFANVNAGELILNRAQQGNLASQLSGGVYSRQMQPYLQAETIYLGINNYLRRTGHGELITAR